MACIKSPSDYITIKPAGGQDSQHQILDLACRFPLVLKILHVAPSFWGYNPV